MNKKVLVIALVLVLAVSSVFAAKADMKVGAQLGYGGRSLTATDNNLRATLASNGFYGAFTFEYGVTDAISVKAEAGINTMGTMVLYMKNTKTGETANPTESPYKTPVNFTLFVGALYNYAINKEFTVYGGAGIDVLMGLAAEDMDDTFNAGIGLGLELGASYAIDKQLSVNVGGKFGWHFINTNENYKDEKFTGLAYKAYAGVTYSI
jgi:opacity protein-like surface antigen